MAAVAAALVAGLPSATPPPVAAVEAVPVQAPAEPAGVELADTGVDPTWDVAAGAEVVAERTPDSQTFTTGQPGVFVTDVYAAPIHYETPAGDLEEIEPGLAAEPDGDLVSTGTGVPVSVDPGADETVVEVALADDASVGFALASDDLDRTDDSTAVVSDVADGVDAELEVTPGGLKETLVLADATAERSFAVPLELDGVEPRLEESGSITLRDPAGEVRGVIPAGWMEDSAAHPVTGEPAQSYGVTYALERTGPTTWSLAIALDDAWLDDPARVYPVLVDPSILQADGAVDDTYVMAYAPGDRSSQLELHVGNNGYLGTRSFIHFPGLDALDGKNIYAAAMKLYQTGASSCTPTPVDVFQVGTAWTGSTTTSYGGPAPAGPRVATTSGAHGATGCPSDWLVIDVTTAMATWADNTVANNGVTLRARDELAPAQFKKFASSETWAPPHVQVIWGETTAQSPSPPGTPLPTGTTAGLAPLLGATFTDPQMDSGVVAFSVYDAAEQRVAEGVGAQVNSSERSTFQVPVGRLAPGRTYRVRAVAIDELLNSSAPVVTTFSTSTTGLVALRTGKTVFGTEQVQLATSLTGVTSMQLVRGTTVVGTDSSPPYVIPWNTTTLADGNQTLIARAILSSGTVNSPAVQVTVANAAVGTERLRLDLEQGSITPDTYAIEGVKLAMGYGTASARYAGAPSPGVSGGSTVDAIGFVTDVQDELTPAAEAPLELLFDPDPPPGQGLSAGEPPTQVQDIGDGCAAPTPQVINSRAGVLCSYVSAPVGSDIPPIVIFYTEGSGSEDVDPTDADSDGFPDVVETVAENMQAAGSVYVDMGYQLPDYVEYLTVVIHNVDAGFANPYFRSRSETPHAISLPADDYDDVADIDEATPRHELFHVFQYNYFAALDVTPGECSQRICRESGLWWLEASAEWADHQFVEQASLVADSEDYYSSFHYLARAAPLNLLYHRLQAADRGRAYGAFIFVEYLQDRYGDDAVHRVFELVDLDAPFPPFGEELTALKAIEQTLNEEGTTLERFLPDFWAATYLLNGIPIGNPLSFDDNAVNDWAARLDQASAFSGFGSIAGDSFAGEARLRRVRPPGTLVPGTPQAIFGPVGFGGAAIADYEKSTNLDGSVEVEFFTNDDRMEKFAVMAVVYRDIQGYSNLCETVEPVYEDEGVISFEIPLRNDCESFSLLIVQTDPDSGYGPGRDYAVALLEFTPDGT